jgi:ribosomal protein L29
MKYTKTLEELRTKSASDLQKVVVDLKEDLRKTRLDIMTGKSKNGAAISKLRKQIARVLTVANEKKA